MDSKLARFLVLLMICNSLTAFAQTAGNKPNIVLILADDLGYGSVNAYGADKKLVRTPHINRLAGEGMRFTHASTPASVCSPTRYGLLTGRYPWRSELKFGTVSPNGALLPDPDGMTIADLLRDQGYNTAAIGKWHLGYGDSKPTDFTGKLTPGPLDLGFDYHFAVPQNHDDYWGVYIENDAIYGLRSKKKYPYSKTFYGQPYKGFDAPQRVNKDVMEELTERSIDWLKKQSVETPFFLYFAPVAVHVPITPSDYMSGLSGAGPYGDFIQDLDLSVGRIIETLEYMNLVENTIIIFSSDNGGGISTDTTAPVHQAIESGLTINGDLRGGKHEIYEGGTRVPLIVTWPGRVDRGSESDAMVNLVDLFATVSDITSGEQPESEDIAPDSISFLPSLLGLANDHPRESMITADANGMQAIRRGKWKYIDDTPPASLPKQTLDAVRLKFEPQLYDLVADPGEKSSLYKKYPEIVETMKAELAHLRMSSSH